MKRQTLLLILISFLTILTSCSSPTSACKGIIEKHIKDFGNGFIEMDDFTKTDGQSGVSAGISWYEIHFVVKVKAVKEGGWLDGTDNKIYKLSAWNVQCQNEQGYTGFDEQHCRQIATKVDQIYEYTGSMILSKHENGWQQEKNVN